MTFNSSTKAHFNGKFVVTLNTWNHLGINVGAKRGIVVSTDRGVVTIQYDDTRIPNAEIVNVQNIILERELIDLEYVTCRDLIERINNISHAIRIRWNLSYEEVDSIRGNDLSGAFTEIQMWMMYDRLMFYWNENAGLNTIVYVPAPTLVYTLHSSIAKFDGMKSHDLMYLSRLRDTLHLIQNRAFITDSTGNVQHS